MSAAERDGGERSLRRSAQPAPGLHQLPADRAAAEEVVPGAAADQIHAAAGAQTQAGEGNRGIQEAAGRRQIRTEEARNVYFISFERLKI